MGEGCRIGENAVVGGAPGSVDFDHWGIAVLGPGMRRYATGQVVQPNTMLERGWQGGRQMKGLHGIIFSYEKENGLRELIENRVHGSVPFGGDYRIIDFILSSMVNAGITDVGVIMHGKCQSPAGSPGQREELGSEPQLWRTDAAARPLPTTSAATETGSSAAGWRRCTA